MVVVLVLVFTLVLMLMLVVVVVLTDRLCIDDGKSTTDTASSEH